MEGIGEKSCRDCGETKPIVGFRKWKGSEDGRALYRRDCCGLRDSATVARRSERQGLPALVPRAKPPAGPEGMKWCQCLICERPGPEHVDHDHETGKVRGIRCFNCDQGLGNFRDDIRSLIRAVNYLMRGSSWKGKGLDGFQGSRPGLAAA
ncbi:MAG TPA: endonuclease domain-containing protein [Actinocrinis sp.]|nr:endonuclease domain-containing protein [Actinocrinis sp.]